MRQSEDHMEVRTRQQPGELGIDPGRTGARGAARAAAVAAGVELLGAEVALGAAQRMTAAQRTEAVADRPGRARLTRMQRALLRVRVEVMLEDILHRAAHTRRSAVNKAAAYRV